MFDFKDMWVVIMIVAIICILLAFGLGVLLGLLI